MSLNVEERVMLFVCVIGKATGYSCFDGGLYFFCFFVFSVKKWVVFRGKRRFFLYVQNIWLLESETPLLKLEGAETDITLGGKGWIFPGLSYWGGSFGFFQMAESLLCHNEARCIFCLSSEPEGEWVSVTQCSRLPFPLLPVSTSPSPPPLPPPLSLPPNQPPLLPPSSLLLCFCTVDDSDPGQSSDMWGERLLPPCRIYAGNCLSWIRRFAVPHEGSETTGEETRAVLQTA